MAKKENDSGPKGTFGSQRFSVAQKYLLTNHRRSMIIFGVAGSLGVLGYLLADFFYFKTSVTSSGPLSSFHATFEKDCTACHVQFKAVSNDNCSTCHEKTGDDLGAYSFASHKVYRSEEYSRLDTLVEETSCRDCHHEHNGRGAAITEVTDTQCTKCHAHEPFESKHPQFDFAAMHTPDDSTLRFTHVRHVKDVMKKQKLVDVERACLYCHHPQPDGKAFEPMQFEEHCQACHLTPTLQSPALRIKNPAEPGVPGVETVEALRAMRGSGMMLASRINGGEFIMKPGNRVVKSPIHHKDPWILENLKMVRRQLYPNLGLAELFMTTGDLQTAGAPSKARAAYREAIQGLRDYSAGMRGRPEPEVRRELSRIDSLLRKVEVKMRKTPHAMANSRMLMPHTDLNPMLTSQQVDELKLFVNDLTKPCQECHMVANASIVRVQKEQRVLHRAEFDHRAHIVHRRCLDCHTGIPIMQAAADSLAMKKVSDRSSIQNVPKIESCAECHNSSDSSNRCVTCHYFHPNKTNRSNLLMYFD